MNGMIGRTVDAATRGLGFLRQYPFLVAAEIAVVTALATMVARAEELIRQQLAGRAAAKSATSHRATLREGLRANLLRPLARVAEVVAHEHPELRGLYRLPKGKTKHQTFRAAARRMTPFSSRRARRISAYSCCSTGVSFRPGNSTNSGSGLANSAECRRRRHAGSNSSQVATGAVSSNERSSRLRSSRTLPGQVWRIRACSAALLSTGAGRP